jgi:hypothetical protein
MQENTKKIQIEIDTNSLLHNWIADCCQNCIWVTGIGKNFLSKRLWPFTWPHQGAILENNVPFQIGNGPQLWLVKLRASLCIDKYHFLDLYELFNMKKQIVKPRHLNKEDVLYMLYRLDLKQANLAIIQLLSLLVSDLTYNMYNVQSNLS